MALLTRKKLVLVETEAVEGTDAAPTTTANALLCEEAMVTPNQAVIERPALKPYMGTLKSVAGGYYADWSLTFELKGAGITAGSTDLPDWDPVFRACGMKRKTDDAADPDTWSYQPHTTGVAAPNPNTTNSASMTMWLYEDSTVWKLTGCHGNMSLTMTAGERCMVTAEGQGFCTSNNVYQGHADLAFPTEATFDAELPSVALSIGWEMGGVATTVYKASTFSLDLGNEIGLRPNFNRLDGYQGAIVTGRNPTGSIDPEMDLLATIDFYTLIKSQTASAIQMTLNAGGGVGEKIDIDAPLAQVVSFAEGDRNGVLTADLGLAFRESSGDDELVIKVY